MVIFIKQTWVPTNKSIFRLHIAGLTNPIFVEETQAFNQHGDVSKPQVNSTKINIFWVRNWDRNMDMRMVEKPTG